MAYDTVIQQGRFTSTGVARTIPIRSDFDWMWVYNETILGDGALAADRGAQFYFQRGMVNGRGIEYRKLGTVANDPLTTLFIAANAGFFVVDSSVSVPSGGTALTAITAANPPVVTTAGALPLIGDIVRLENLDNQPQIANLDFTVTNVGGGTFTIGNISLTNSVASTAGSFRIVPFDSMYYPRNRSITYVSSEAQAKIYLSVTHNLTVGQEVRLNFPGGSEVWGDYGALDGRTATVLAVNVARAGNEPVNLQGPNNIRVDIDTSTFTVWDASFGAGLNESYPAAAEVPFSPAQVVPYGMDTAQAITSGVDILADRTRNESIIGVRLAAGNNSPGGALNDVMYWVAGKSFSVDNQ